MASNGVNESVNAGKKDGVLSEAVQEVKHIQSSNQVEDIERKARVNAAWEEMNSGTSAELPKFLTNKAASTRSKASQKTTPNWMVSLGLAPKKAYTGQASPANRSNGLQASEEAKKFASAALSAVKDAVAAAAVSAASRGKVEISEVRDFAGEEIEVKKLVDANSKEAAEKGTGPSSGIDAILEQIKKKPKLSVLDKTKKDWGEFKEEHRGLEDELDAYKKSSNQYLEKVSFLQRTDYREFERERDVRLAQQSKRGRSDMREEP